MNNQTHFDLNLASHPLANRRLFFLCGFLLGLVFLVVLIAGGRIFLVYGAKASSLKSSITKLDQEGKKVLRNTEQHFSMIDALVKDNKKKVDLINSLILRKSFSWVDFLSILEETLPNECYIVSLSPAFKEETQVEFRLVLASPNLDALLKFVQNLDRQGFKQIRISNESRADTGFFLYEMVLSYERHI